MGSTPEIKLRHTARRYRTRRRAVTSIEYAVLLMLIGVVELGAIMSLGWGTNSAYTNFSSAMPHVLTNVSAPNHTAEGPRTHQRFARD